MTAYSESNIEYIRKHKQYYFSSMDNIFSATYSEGAIAFILGC